jgi:hypothetical protein
VVFAADSSSERIREVAQACSARPERPSLLAVGTFAHLEAAITALNARTHALLPGVTLAAELVGVLTGWPNRGHQERRIEALAELLSLAGIGIP